MPTHVYTVYCQEANPEVVIARLSLFDFHGFEEEANQVLAYSQQELDKAALTNVVDSLGAKLVDVASIPDQNWNEQWESSFQPILFEEKVYVRAAFHEAHPNPGVIDIVITPEMAFGTGHHPTTAMVIQSILGMDLKEKSLFDFGAGTGILAILAHKCGAAPVSGVEIEHRAVESASSNTLLNDCPEIQINQGDSMPEIEPVDVILANVNRRVILETIPSFSKYLKKTGKLIVSGILHLDQHIVKETASAHNFIHTGTLQQGDWLCMSFQRS